MLILISEWDEKCPPNHRHYSESSLKQNHLIQHKSHLEKNLSYFCQGFYEIPEGFQLQQSWLGAIVNWDMSSEVDVCVGCLRKYCLKACTEASFFKASHHLVLKVLPRVGKAANSSTIMIQSHLTIQARPNSLKKNSKWGKAKSSLGIKKK